jgi:hypothetical protein
LAAITYPIHQLSLESNFEGDRGVYMVGGGEEPLRRPSKRSSGRLRRKLLGQLVWPGMLKEESNTMACRMTQGHLMMSLGMALLREYTTQSSIQGAQQIETDSETSHDQSKRRLVRLNTKERRST